MRFWSLVIVVFLFLKISKINAQSYDLGKVTVEELKEKVNPKDTAAPATILFKKGRTFYTFTKNKGFFANHVYEFKIKIYKKEGLRWADQKVRFYIGYESLNEDKLEFSNAVTYNLENGSIVKNKLDNQGKFKKKVNKYWSEKIITLPNVKEGSIIEYKYVLKSENIVKLPDFDFQYDIPVNYFEYKTDIPEYYIYKAILTGGHKLETDSKLINTRQTFIDDYGKATLISYNQISAFYRGKDFPALIQEPYVDNIENYKGSIRHELERVRYPDEPVKDYAMTWEGVATTIFKDENFGKELKERSFLLEDVKKLLTNVESQEERLNSIFKFVQNKMNWNEVSACYTDKGVKKAYEDQIGNTAEINFILISMLKLAGIDVSPVLVSTIENGIQVYPTRIGFNYVIAAAEIDGKQLFLDATNKFTYPGGLPLNVLNWKGRLIKDDGTSNEVDLMPTKTSREFKSVKVKVDNLGKIEGKARIQRADYEAYRFRVEKANGNQGNYLEKLEDQLGDLRISDYKIEDKKTNLQDIVEETFSFLSDNQVDVIGGKIFIKPLLFFTRSKNPFTQEVRQMPVYFGYPTQENINLNIEIPEGYVIESLPAPIRISLENKEIVYFFDISSQGNKIQINCLKEINNSIFATEKYSGLKDLFQKISASQNEKIVLKRI